MPEIDFVLSHYGDHGWGVRSPQIPGLIAGQPKLDAITPAYLMDLATDAGVDTNDGFRVHVDRVVEVGNVVCHVIARQLPAVPEVLGPVQAMVVKTLEADPAMATDAPADDLGERYFVAALASDTVGSLARAVPEASAFVAVVPTDAQLLWIRLVPELPGESAAQISRDRELLSLIDRHADALGNERTLAFA